MSVRHEENIDVTMNKTQPFTDYYGSDLEAMAVAENYNQWIYEEFKPYLRGDVAEVGAGIGNFSKYLLQAPILKLKLFEPSGNMYPVLADRYSGEGDKVTTHNIYFSEIKEKFDTVVYCNVMEHVADDYQEMIKVRNCLNTGGHFLLFVPALEFLFSRMDYEIGHYRRYVKSGLVNSLEKAGYEVVKAKYFDILGIIPWYIYFVLLKGSYSRTNVSLYDRIIIPFSKFFENFLPPPFGKNLVIVARVDD